MADNEHVLLPTQRVAVSEAIKAAGFDAAEFDWRTRPGEVTRFGLGHDTMYVPMLVHRPSGFYFVFDFDWADDFHHAIYSPGDEVPVERMAAGPEWSAELGYVRRWLGLVRREHGVRDPWAEVGRERVLLALPRPETSNALFTEDERRLISRELGELRKVLVDRYELEEVQLEELDDRLRELQEATGRLGRLDWRSVMLAELVGLLVRAVIPEGAFREAGMFLMRTIGHLVGLDGVPELPGEQPPISA